MKIMNKILAALLVLVMVATMIPVAFAEGTVYETESGTTVNVNLTMNNISGFQIYWSDITYSNKGIITSVAGDGSQMNLLGKVYDDVGAFYFPDSGATNAVFTLKFAVSGAVGQTCDISVKYKVVDAGSNYSREVTDTFSIKIIPSHTHSYVWESDDNQHWQKCSCGDKISVGAHQWGWVTDTNPGEFTPGVKHEECSDCGRTRNENTPIDPTHQHQHGNWSSDDNQHWKECSCGDKISVGAHQWDWVTDTNPGEFTPGKKHEECRDCGKMRNLNTPIDPTHQHQYGGWVRNDSQHWKECSCGDKIFVGDHQWGWVVDSNPSEFTPGKQHEECRDCGGTRNENTPINPTHQHQYGGWRSDDNQHWKECSCGDKISVGAHQWGWVTDTNPGEFTPGKKHEECSDCGKMRSLNTPIDPTHQHQYGGWVSNGSQHWKECSCGDKTSLGDHKWIWVIDSNPSASAPGKKHEECETCGYKQAQQDIPYDGQGTPSTPTDPTTPSTPTDPTTPSTPTGPSDLDEPTTPGATGDPTEPTEPGEQEPGKHGSCWIWWLLLLLIIAALVYYFYRRYKKKEAEKKDNQLKD